MKRMKGVEDLNICTIGAQGIVGVGANNFISIPQERFKRRYTPSTGSAAFVIKKHRVRHSRAGAQTDVRRQIIPDLRYYPLMPLQYLSHLQAGKVRLRCSMALCLAIWDLQNVNVDRPVNSTRTFRTLL